MPNFAEDAMENTTAMKNVSSTIIIGDCLEVLPGFPDNSIDCIFTSPPYNRERNDVYSHYDDTIKDYFAFLKAFTDEAIRISPLVFVNIQPNYYNKAEVNRYIGHYAKEISHTFIWSKENPTPASGKNITNAFEYFFVFSEKLNANKTYVKNHIHTSVNPDTDKSHGAIMNIKVAKQFIDNFTNEGDVVLDPFLGAGTTARACKDLHRSCIGIEISTHYAQIAENRLKQELLL